MASSRLCLCVAAVLLRLATAQTQGWITDQINTTMCYWQNLRAGVIRNTVYLDGGAMYWNPGLSDGSYAAPSPDANLLGLVYLLNFSTPFDTSSNVSALMTNISKAIGGTGNANSNGPLYFDGTMFANDFEFFTYGGLLSNTEEYQAPSAQSLTEYQKYSAIPGRDFIPGVYSPSLPDTMTRYLVYGAGVSVPSENLGFYFGGLRSASGGDITMYPQNATDLADVESSTLISIDMSLQEKETWHNDTVPSSVPGRAGAEIAWVPVSNQGVLVAIGGVVDPDYAILPADVETASEIATNTATSPKFMETVAVYDIAKKQWYEQPTSGTIPGQLTQGCTVVASSEDGSSHNIYWYGGYSGFNVSIGYSDDVWVLSVPSFVWVKVYDGTSAHARAGHRCVKPYPDQMFVIGGIPATPNDGSAPCLDNGIVQVYNLSSSKWLGSYDPKVWSNYTVPSQVVDAIGGNGLGNATMTVPSPTGFANSNMTAVFNQLYNQAKITNWYPYPSSSSTSAAASLTPAGSSKSSTPSYLAPVLGVVLGLFFIASIILGFLLLRRRSRRSNNGTSSSESGNVDSRFWIANWLRATPVSEKAPPTVTTDERPVSSYDDQSWPAEFEDTQVHELMDTSPPAELWTNDTGLVQMQGRSGFSASQSNASRTKRNSRASRNSHGSPIRPAFSPVQPLVDSPSPEGSPEANRILSSVSSVSDNDRGHMRGISDTSVSTDGIYSAPVESDTAAQETPETSANISSPKTVSPLTPTAFKNHPD